MKSQGSSLWQDAWHRLSRNRPALVSLAVLVVILVACFIGPFLWFVKSPTEIHLANGVAAPSPEHWFGTDQLGRDLFSRVLYGGRVSLLVGLVATGVAVIIGVIYGAISGYVGGIVIDDNNADAAQLPWFVPSDKAHGQRISRQALAIAMDNCRAPSFPLVVLTTFRSVEKAPAFTSSLGSG